MSKTLRHFIRETIEELNIGGKTLKLDLMQFNSPDYAATKQRFPRAGLVLDRYVRAFETAKELRLKYLDDNFVDRLELLVDHLAKNGVNVDIKNINTEKLRIAMREAVLAAPLKIMRYDDNIDTHLVPTAEGNFFYDPITSDWTQLITAVLGHTGNAFAFMGTVYSPPPLLLFDKDKRLIGAEQHREQLVQLFEHELEHVESYAAKVLLASGNKDIVNPADLDAILLRSALRPASEITPTNMQDFVRRTKLDFVFSKDPQKNESAMCFYLAVLAAIIATESSPAYETAATAIASALKISNDLWVEVNEMALDHGSDDHLRTSLFILASALNKIDEQLDDRIAVANNAIDLMKREASLTQTFRSAALLAVIDMSKYEFIKLVAAADTPTTRNQA